jgi:hypothetical protein
MNNNPKKSEIFFNLKILKNFLEVKNLLEICERMNALDSNPALSSLVFCVPPHQ